MKSAVSILSSPIVIVLAIIFSVNIALGDNIVREFDAKERVIIKTLSGDCEIKKANTDKITVEVISHVRPGHVFDAIMRDRGSSLKLTEKIRGSSEGPSFWIVTVPEGTEIDFNSTSGGLVVSDISGEFYGNTASGNYELNNCRGRFDLNTASGDYLIEDCRGEFEINSASGNLNIRNVVVEDKSNFSSASGRVRARNVVIDDVCNFGSASGDVDVELARSPKEDLNVGSASGDASLDYQGNDLAGYIEMTVKKRGGSIRSDIEFDDEEEFYKHDQLYIRKYATIGDDFPRISVGSATGRAELSR